MQLNFPKYYLRHANCIVQRGYSRSAIFDLQRGKYWLITNEWERVLNRSFQLKSKDIIEALDELTAHDIFSFLQFLVEEDILLPSNTSIKSHFNPLPQKRESVCAIEVLSIEFARKTKSMVPEIISSFFVKHVLFFIEQPGQEFRNYLHSFSTSRIQTITIVIKNKELTLSKLSQLIDHEPRIRTIFIPDKTAVFESKIQHCHIRKFGQTQPRRTQQYVIHSDHFIDSKEFHTFYNKRVHITANGDIKNAHHWKKTHGNIFSESLEDIIKKKSFRSIWQTKKQDTDICCDCEFAPICIDRRELFQRMDGTWYAKEECTYNPYICKEEGEPDYLSLSASGITSNARGFRIEIDRFLNAKERIWG